jgi:phosphoribosylformylglycinamidine cyclo-ligase
VERKTLTYSEAGVDIEAANLTKQRIKSVVDSTFGPEVLSDVGSFGGLFAPKWQKYRDPVIVSSVDGVGTKLKVAFRMGVHNTVGIDIVSHCVNDILVQGAEPLFFMDYIAMAEHRGDVVVEIIEGIAQGCRAANCALLGGEMAELPEFYHQEEYDLVGMIVGIVERRKIINGSNIKAGDLVVGLASDGLHTNGYSLARKLLFEVAGLDVHSFVESLGKTIGEELLTPHRCYARSVLKLLETFPVSGIAHITGGGFLDNIPRILPSEMGAEIRLGTWEIPPIFSFLQQTGDVPQEEMFHTFNMGIGLVLIVPDQSGEQIQQFLEEQGERTFLIGKIVRGEQKVSFV